MSIEDDFYATIKFKSGEEIFAKVAASEEEDRTMLILHHPIIIGEIKGKSGIVGYKVEPWLKTSREDMFIINMDNILTLSESGDLEMITMYKRYLKDTESDRKNNLKALAKEKSPDIKRRMTLATSDAMLIADYAKNIFDNTK